MSQEEYPAESSSKAARRPFIRAATTAANGSDSGYGSIAEDVRNFDLTDGEESMPEPPRVPILGDRPTADTPEFERRQHQSHVQELHYNQNRVALGRSINRTIDTLRGLQEMNRRWPAHYPAVQARSPEAPHLTRNQSSADDYFHNGHAHQAVGPHRPNRHQAPIRRAMTHVGRNEPASNVSSEPRLVSPQISQEFNVLKLDLRIGSLSQSELVHSLEKQSIASLLDNKLQHAMKHLASLRDRIEDTSSKVLVTGDLNAGKSTFCNALLRKQILPEDQQPMTEIFCEVMDALKNNGVEEVHAVHKKATYSRNDERTYDVFPLEELDKVVCEVEKYSSAKIYVEDGRQIDESLLKNGVVDIALIDAPGLNLDSMQTTAVFARQEEIDVVVFVVSAENHFTQSAKEFIWNAANEKAYIFIVVNRFDNIRDKVKCQRVILDQIANLSPKTHRDSQDLVHFVSSNAIIDGKDPDKINDFNHLESSLRGFVLDKRARSKLGPAKSYLLNLLSDLESLAMVNQNVAARELDNLRSELQRLTPEFDKSVKARSDVSDECDRQIDETCNTVYRNTRREISRTITTIDETQSVPFTGVLSSWTFAEDVRRAMIDLVTKAVVDCEDAARRSTVAGVSAINALGVLHLKKEYVERTFRPDLMFKKKRDALSRTIQTQVDVFDFFDFDRQEKVAGMSLSLTVVSVAGSKLLGIGSWVDGVWRATNILGVQNARRLIIPAVIAAIGAGAFYLAQDVHRAIPRKLAKKIRQELADMDYTHMNAERVSKEVRKVLRFPAEELRGGFQKSIEGLKVKKEETAKKKGECEVANKYFGNLLREARDHSSVVRRYDLEATTGH